FGSTIRALASSVLSHCPRDSCNAHVRWPDVSLSFARRLLRPSIHNHDFRRLFITIQSILASLQHRVNLSLVITDADDEEYASRSVLSGVVALKLLLVPV